MANVAWTQSEGKLYAEISDFGKEKPNCGKCKGELPKLTNDTERRDGENEITHWEVRCQCGQTCVLFND